MAITAKQLYSKKDLIRTLAIIMFLNLCIFPVLGQDSKITDIKIFYQNNCAKCHGSDGSAVGEDGKRLKGADFTDQKWLKETTDDEMTKTIIKGKFFGLAMPAFKDKVTEEEAQLIVTEIIRKSEKGKIIAP